MTEQQLPQTDRRDLKIQALINKVTKVENENADYQVELHVRTEELQAAQQELASLRAQLEQQNAGNEVEVVPGEVVAEPTE